MVNLVGSANRVASLRSAYAKDSLAGKALASMADDLAKGKLSAATRKHLAEIQKDELFKGSSVLNVLEGSAAAFEEVEPDEGNAGQ
jgi:ferritin-like metal-binding protein YciE